MFDTVVIATDGSASSERAVAVALDFAEQFDSSVHALCVMDERELAGSPETVREDYEAALREQAEDALRTVEARADRGVQTAVREGHPPTEIESYATDHDADVIAMGTRGRHGEHGYVIGSVAKAVLRRCPMPVLTVRQLEAHG